MRFLTGTILLLSGLASGQTTYISEHFAAWPAPGWSTIRANTLPPGWNHDPLQERAEHDHTVSVFVPFLNDDFIVTPTMDLSAASQVFLHFKGETLFSGLLANHPSSIGDGFNNVEVTTDGGASWTTVWTDTSLGVDDFYFPDIDLSAWAGASTLQLGFHYHGTDAQIWWVDDVVVDSSPQGPPPSGTLWHPNLPSSFRTAPFREDFDSLAGVVPSSMALTCIDPATGASIPAPLGLAWCNIGQQAPSIDPFSPSFDLEMGLDPNSGLVQQVRNMAVLGIAGNGQTALHLDFMGKTVGDASDKIDGIWISSDGAQWYAVTGDWRTTLPPTNAWTHVTDVDLTGSPVDTSSNFYLMIAQEGPFAFNLFAGVTIDDIAIDSFPGGGSGPVYSIANLIAGQTSTFSVTGASAGGRVLIGYSLNGPGPIPSVFGPVDMSPRIFTLARLIADGSGNAGLPIPVPPGIAGLRLYTQAIDLDGSRLTNSLAATVQ